MMDSVPQQSRTCAALLKADALIRVSIVQGLIGRDALRGEAATKFAKRYLW
jgi:hypothetical protein